MRSASASRSTPTAPPGAATIAHGAEAVGWTESLVQALSDRGLDVELLERLGVRASKGPAGDGDWIAIPFLEDGVEVACKYRTVGPGKKRFTQKAGGKQVLWNVDVLQDESLKGEPLIITEGEMDAFAAIQAGFPRTVSVPGGAPADDDGDVSKRFGFLDHADSLKGVQEIIIAADADGPGANLLTQLGLRLGRQRCKWIEYPDGCKDLNDVLRDFGPDVVGQVLAGAKWVHVDGVYKMSELPPVNPPMAHDIGMPGLATQFKARQGDMVVVTGVPGHGKSSLVNDICCRLAVNFGWVTVFGSFEQSPQTDHRRALRTFNRGKLERDMKPHEIAAADKWIDQNFGFIVPSEDDNPTLQWFLERAAAAVIRFGGRVLVLDPWNELEHSRPPDMTMTEYVGFAIRQLKKFAKKYNVLLIVVSHPAKMRRNNDGTYPVPSLYDISDSAHWSNKADLGMVVYRPDVAANPVTWIRTVKSRYQNEIGRPGEVHATFDESTSRFTIVDDKAGMSADAPH